MAHLALHSWRTGPYQYQDELAYLAAARYMAGVGAEPLLSPMPFYYPGYSLLLAPLYLLLREPGAVYEAALATNAVLAAALVAPLYVLGRRLLGLGARPAVLAAVATAAYPAFLLQSGTAWTESLFHLLFGLWAVAGLALARRPSARRAIALATLTGVAFAVHARAAALVLAALVLVGALRLTRSLSTGAMAAAVAVVAAILAGTRLLSSHLVTRIYEPEPLRPSELDLIRPLGGIGGWWELALAALGQLWYLSVASLGLAVLGAAALAVLAGRALRDARARRAPDPRGAAAALVLIAVAGTFLISSAWMAANFARVDHLVFGRYNEGVVMVLILAGIATLTRARPRRLAAALGGAAAAGLAVAALLRLGHGPDAFEGLVAPVAVLGVMAWTPDANAIPVVHVALAAGLATCLLAGVALERRTAAVVGVALVFAASAVSVNERVMKDYVTPWMTAATTQAIAPHVADLGPLAFDRASNTVAGRPAQNLHHFWLQDAPLLPYSSAAGGEPRAALVITATSWPDGERRGARLVYPETAVPQALWALPGPAQDALARRGLLLPPPPGRTLPPEARRAELRVVPPIPGVMEAGGAASLTALVRHAGRGSPWAPVPALPPPHMGGVRVVAFWHPDVGGHAPPAAAQIAELPRTLLPGERASTELRLAARGSGGEPLSPGRYRLRVVLLQEGIGDLETTGHGERSVLVVDP